MRALRYDLFTILTVSESCGRHINIYKLKCLRSQRNVGFGGDCGQLREALTSSSNSHLRKWLYSHETFMWAAFTAFMWAVVDFFSDTHILIWASSNCSKLTIDTILQKRQRPCKVKVLGKITQLVTGKARIRNWNSMDVSPVILINN